MSSVGAHFRNHQHLLLIFTGLFSVALLVFIVYWLAFAPMPGTDFDIMEPWAMIKGLQQHTDWHPYPYAVWLGVISFGLPSSVDAYRIATVVNFTIAAFILSSCSTWLVWRGVPSWLIIAGYLICLLNPITALMSISLLKDIPASLFVLALLFLWLHINSIELRWNVRAVLLIILAVFVTYMASNLRHNHKFLPFLMIALLWLFARGVHWKLKLLYTVFSIIAILSTTLPISLRLVRPSPERRVLAKKVWMMNYNYVNGSPSLSTDEITFLDRIAPNDKFGIKGCSVVDFSGRLNHQPGMYQQEVAEIDRIFWEEVTLNPQLLLSQRACVFAHTMGLGFSVYRYPLHDGIKQGLAERSGIPDVQQVSLLPEVRRFIRDLGDWITAPPQSFLLNTHIPALFMVFLVGVVGLYKRHSGLVGVSVILLSLTLSVFVLGTGQRYTYLAFLHFFVFYSVAMLLLPWFEERKATKSQTGMSEISTA